MDLWVWAEEFLPLNVDGNFENGRSYGYSEFLNRLNVHFQYHPLSLTGFHIDSISLWPRYKYNENFTIFTVQIQSLSD